MSDPFQTERRQLQRVRDELIEEDYAVSLGEWCADQLFGDPHLTEVAIDVDAARGALEACIRLLDHAVERLEPTERAESRGSDA